MLLQLDAEMSDSIDKILHAAATLLRRAHKSYRDGDLTGDEITAVLELRDDLGQLIAKLSDGTFDASEIQAAAVDAARQYEQMADDWLAAVYATAEAAHDEITRVGPGRYVVTRTVGGVTNSIPCTNPAVATKHLDQWELAAKEAA